MDEGMVGGVLMMGRPWLTGPLRVSCGSPRMSEKLTNESCTGCAAHGVSLVQGSNVSLGKE